MQPPKISVVIPTYNRKTTVARAIDSALQQTLWPHEIIVVDDASTDGTEAFIRERYGSRVKLVRLPLNSGGASARNAGADLAQGDILAFLDSDDCWYPEKLQRQWSLYKSEQKNDSIIIYCKADLGNINARYNSPTRALMPNERVEDYIFVHSQDIQTSSYFMSRKLFSRIRFSEGLRRHQDIDFVIRAQHKNIRFSFINENLYQRLPSGFGDSVGSVRDDGISLAWANAARPMMSAAAYHHFTTKRILPVVICARPWLAIRLTAAAIGAGQPAFRSFLRALAKCLLRTSGWRRTHG